MANPESISYIKLNDREHPIDAVTIGEKSASDLLNKDGLVTSVNSSSDDEHYPSAKCVYDIIYGSNGGGVVTNNNYIKLSNNKLNKTAEPSVLEQLLHINRTQIYYVKEIGSDFSIEDSNNLPILYDNDDNEIMYNSVSFNENIGIYTFNTSILKYYIERSIDGGHWVSMVEGGNCDN